ncbi:MAG: hypothetical protein ABI273_09765, partial [Lacunisphaera sp.]
PSPFRQIVLAAPKPCAKAGPIAGCGHPAHNQRYGVILIVGSVAARQLRVTAGLKKKAAQRRPRIGRRR